MSAGIPFWDPGVTAVPGSVSSLLPENESQTWPDQLSPFNTIKFAKRRAPGLCVLKGGKSKRFTAETTPNVTGSIFNFYGYDYSQFTVKLHLWTPAQWTWLQWWLPLISPPSRAAVTPKAMKVEHPSLRLHRVTDAYVVHVGFPDIDDKGMMTLDIECVEYIYHPTSGAGVVKSSDSTIRNPDGTAVTQTDPPNAPQVPPVTP